MSCGDLSFVEGGVIKDADILNGSISNSTVNNPTINGGSLNGLTSVDEPTAKKIADAEASSAGARQSLANGLAGDSVATGALANGLAANATGMKALADALSGLSKEQLSALAQALWDALDLHPKATAAPATGEADSLPTTLYGTRSAILGGPTQWLDSELGAIPVYPKGA